MRFQLRQALIAVGMTVIASLCLTAVVDRADWMAPAVLAAAVVAAVGQLARRVYLPRPFAPVASALALFVVVVFVFVFADDDALFGVLPSPEALRSLLAFGAQGLVEMNEYAAPVSRAPGIGFLTVLGVSVVAIIVDTLAVTYRRPALAGFPLLGFYLVPLTVTPDGVPWPLFVVAAGACLVLLLGDARDRVGGWGHILRGSSRAGSRGGAALDAAPVAALGRRLGVGVVAVAVVVPMLAPGLDIPPGDELGQRQRPE